MNNRVIKYTAAAVLAFGLTSCGIYKKYELPTDNAVVNDYAKALQAEQDSTTLGNLGWRQVFTDPLLQRYIQTALDNNKDLDNARLNIDIANAQLKGAKLSYFPSLTFAPNGAGAKYGRNDMNWTYQLPLQASWEVDIFGKLLNQKRAAQVGVEMADAYRQATQSQIIAGVARCYYQIVMLNQQLDLTRRTAVIWEDQVKSMKLMKEAAKTNEAAVVQAQANYHSLLASIPDLELSIHQAQNSLSLLLNSYPQTWAVTSDMEFNMPATIDGGVPMSYLAVRPDVRAAERSFASAYYATNQARANFYPSLNISAAGGFTNNIGMIVNPGKWFINLAGSLTAPLFSRGRNIAQLEAAKAQQQQALNDFQYSILNAAGQVSDALSEINCAASKREKLMLQIDDLEKSVNYTEILFTTADATYLELLTSRASLLNAQMAALNCWYQRVGGIIYLYQTLGGGR